MSSTLSNAGPSNSSSGPQGAASHRPAPPRAGKPPLDEDQHPRLPIHEVGMANRRAQIRGTMSGIATGIAAALAGRTLLRFSPNATMLTGLLSGTTAGYLATSHQLQFGLADVERSVKLRSGAYEQQRLQAAAGAGGAQLQSAAGAWEQQATQADLRAADETTFEAGVGGMHEFVDRAASTRGDH